MHFIELKICEKVGSVLEECNKIYNRDSFQLLLVWLESEVFDRIIDGDVALYSQAKSYIVRVFMNENKVQLDAVQSEVVMPDEAMFWCGYLLAYWCLEYRETAKNISKKYDWESVLCSYEVLHSLSVKAAIEKIREDYLRG